MLSKEKGDSVFQRAGSDIGLGFELFVFRASWLLLVSARTKVGLLSVLVRHNSTDTRITR